MAISDRGTSGLGGPTRADDAVTEDHDFVSFVRNIGEPRDTELGGGTYGFGKGIFYLVSRPGTILLHTRCKVDGGYETRLMGCALWRSYIANATGEDRRYTGRHWWGDISGDVVEPLVGAAAEAIAHRLGLKPFAPEETGTTLVMVDPNLEGLEPAEAAEYLAETITWHLWPKMLESADGRPAMRFSVTCDGIEYSVPNPRETRPLNLFVAAYEKMAGPEGKGLECYKPKQFLGRLGLVKRTAPTLEPTRASRMVGIETLVHHICLMRPAELVVTYHAGPKPPSEYQSYAGVFRADEALDETYAKAEPPTHDAWHAQTLEYPGSRFVNTTFRRIEDSLNRLLSLGGTVRGGSAKIALGAASTKFSSLVGGSWGMGGETDYGKPGSTKTRPRESLPEEPDDHQNPPFRSDTTFEAHGRAVRETVGSAPDDSGSRPEEINGLAGPTVAGTATSSAGTGVGNGIGSDTFAGTSAAWSGAPSTRAEETVAPSRPARRRPRVDYVRDPYYDERSGASVLIQEFRLPIAGLQRVRAELAVALTEGSGGRETDPPLGAEKPDLVGWESATGDLFTTPTCTIYGGDGSLWRMVVRPAADTMTEIEILTEAVQIA